MCPEEEELIFTGRFSAVQLTCIGIPRRCLSKANSWALPQTDRLLGCGTWGSFKPAPEVAVLTKLRTAGPKEWCRGLGEAKEGLQIGSSDMLPWGFFFCYLDCSVCLLTPGPNKIKAQAS